MFVLWQKAYKHTKDNKLKMNMFLPTPEQIRNLLGHLNNLGISYQKLSRITGVPTTTLFRIATGKTDNFAYETGFRIARSLKDSLDEGTFNRIFGVTPKPAGTEVLGKTTLEELVTYALEVLPDAECNPLVLSLYVSNNTVRRAYIAKLLESKEVLKTRLEEARSYLGEKIEEELANPRENTPQKVERDTITYIDIMDLILDNPIMHNISLGGGEEEQRLLKDAYMVFYLASLNYDIGFPSIIQGNNSSTFVLRNALENIANRLQREANSEVLDKVTGLANLYLRLLGT